jgi:hypothetical protein
MFTGTVIDDLIRTVEQAEQKQTYRRQRWAEPLPIVQIYPLFFAEGYQPSFSADGYRPWYGMEMASGAA